MVIYFRRYVRRQIENLKKYDSSNKDFFLGKADSDILLAFECTINQQNLMKIVGAIFKKMKILNFFLCELPLILRVDRKRKKRAGYICKRTLDIERQRHRSVGLGVTLSDAQKIKNYFSSFRDFSGKSQHSSVILLGFKCTINPQYLIKIVRAIFEKFEILNFFHM